jgi:hypothetical protein
MRESTDNVKKRLWAEGYLVGTISVWNCPIKPEYADANGKVYVGKERQGHKLAAIHTEGLETVEIQFFTEEIHVKLSDAEYEEHYKKIVGIEE